MAKYKIEIYFDAQDKHQASDMAKNTFSNFNHDNSLLYLYDEGDFRVLSLRK